MANGTEAPKPDDQVKGFKKDQVALWRAELSALGGALLFVAIGFAAILLVAKVADVKDGTVLASLLIVPALLYLLLSGRVSDLKGPGGLEVQLAKVANQTIPVSGHDGGGAALSYEEVRPVERGRAESFLDRVRNITPADPVVLTLTVGSGKIDGKVAADYARGLTQFPRFRFVAVLNEDKTLISYMDESAFRHVIDRRCDRRRDPARQHRAQEPRPDSRLHRHDHHHRRARDQRRRRAADHGTGADRRAAGDRSRARSRGSSSATGSPTPCC